ncbi:MAG TPA: nuclear transport factor 2 family protein [Solirubrobacteraceae bacterium]|nr:nuclear transport factor 2 family protein [Solirubrobacteraceae bacterium]
MGQDNVELLRRLYQQWEQGDLLTVDAFHPQVEFVRIGSDYRGLAGQWRGVDEMWTAIVEWLRSWEHLHVEAERFYGLDDRVLVLSREIARGKRSGEQVDHEIGDLFTVRDGKIVRWENYWDRTEAIRAAGLRE